MFDSNKHHRRSIRLKHFDYSRPGGYFITICTHNRECLFGEIVDGATNLNPIGSIVEDEWNKTSLMRNNVELGGFVVMPNHLHGIIILNGDGRRGELQFAPTRYASPSRTIGAIVRGFKSASTTRINAIRKTPGVPVWQRNYYEHIIRGDKDLNAVCEYIANNPLRWQYDRENAMRNPDKVSGFQRQRKRL